MAKTNRLEELCTRLIKNESVADWECLNRLEEYLVCILTRQGMEHLGEPLNRLEELLQALYVVVPENALEILAARFELLEGVEETIEVLKARLEAQK